MSEGPLFVPGVWGPFWSTIIPGLWSAEGGQSAAGKLVSSYSWQIYGNLGTILPSLWVIFVSTLMHGLYSTMVHKMY